MQIFLRTPSSKTLVLSVDEQISVDELKERVFERTMVPPTLFSLLWNGKTLGGLASAKTRSLPAGLGRDSTLHMVCRTFSPHVSLLEAASSGNERVVRWYLRLRAQHPAFLGAAGKDTGKDSATTPLLLACKHGHAPLVRLLLEARLGVHVRDKEGSTPIHVAIRNQHPDVVLEILRHHTLVDLAALDAKHRTPIVAACALASRAGLRGRELKTSISICEMLKDHELRCRMPRLAGPARQSTLSMFQHLPSTLQWWHARSIRFKHGPQTRWAKHAWLREWGAQQLRVYGRTLNLSASRESPLDGVFEAVCQEGAPIGGLNVVFEDEAAYGDGLRREWFELAFAHLQNPSHGLFAVRKFHVSRSAGVDAPPETRAFLEPSHESTLANDQDEHWFCCFGIILVLALSYGEVLGGGTPLSPAFARLLLGHRLSTERDLRCIDPELHRNAVLRVLESDVTGWGLHFVGNDISPSRLGQKRKRETELVEGGADMEVTEANKEKFVRMLSAHLCKEYTGNIAAQVKAVRCGMALACGGNPETLRKLCYLVGTAAELDALLRGVAAPNINSRQWESEVKYEPTSAASSSVVEWFWELVHHELSPEQRSELLCFCTGCRHLPPGGFSQLSGYDGNLAPFTIELLPLSKGNRTLTASTCFNTLRLRKYDSKRDLKEQLLLALTAGRTGGFSEAALEAEVDDYYY